ncbi:DNA/RNA non-specific endonuclease [Hahella sp. CR1]|uniref:DNA/RNA non-specific endonuclease n=1 Tax=Hahella sp. CR1 TaxID=2992807 RepID=UPI002442A1C6|nr:DNA/RNA non-specific endonuclease [Hahella sp. CR1]MDG9667070.1 DNA/RNA non-specific endonuclease [Hahella sp. CR1]
MSGYDDNFLTGINLPLPTYSVYLSSHVLGNQPSLRNGQIADYIHYSLVINSETNKRSPLFVALNIDQNLYKKTGRSNKWRIDPRIGFENQLDNAYYRSNPWDRGHMARRTSAAWGVNKQEAQHASDETFYYSNSCLQHENLNQDEWLGLEDWVYALNLDDDGKITVFSGPFYADFDRSITPSGRDLALIPAGFFKVVCFKNKDSKALDVRAFVMYQDTEALRDKEGRTRYNNQTYQSTITEIERLTGLVFDASIYHANPLYFTPENAAPSENVTETPERIEVGQPSEIVNTGDRRQTIKDDIVDIFISAAMVDPTGADQGNEWISLTNLGNQDINIADWVLNDNAASLTIGTVLSDTLVKPGESRVIKPIDPIKLANNGDIIRLFDGVGNRIDWVNYIKPMLKTGVPVVFLSPRDTLDQ